MQLFMYIATTSSTGHIGKAKDACNDAYEKDREEVPLSPKSPGPLGGERKSPDGGIGSPKEVGDADQRSPTVELKQLTVDAKKVEGSTSMPSSSGDSSIASPTRQPQATVPATSPSSSRPPPFKPQMPMTAPSQRGDETKYWVGQPKKPSPLAVRKESSNSHPRPRKPSISAPGSPCEMGYVLGSRDEHHRVSHDVLASNGVHLRHHRGGKRHMSPPLQGESQHNLAVSSNLKKMNRLSRSIGDALDQLAMMDSSGEFPSSSDVVHSTSTDSAPTPPVPDGQRKDEASSSDEEFGFHGNQGRKDMSSSPTELIRAISPKVDTFVGSSTLTPFNRADPRTQSFNTYERMPGLKQPPYTRSFTAEAKVFLDANGTLPRGAKVRRSFAVRQKWKDDMDTGAGAGKGHPVDLTKEQEVRRCLAWNNWKTGSCDGHVTVLVIHYPQIDHWKLTAADLEKKLSSTKFDLDKKVRSNIFMLVVMIVT